jgi:hypothetical protein
MKPEDKVATLEQCKKFVKLGVILNTQYAYVRGFLMLWSGIESCDVDELCVPAPDVSELGIILPYNDVSIWKEGEIFNADIEVFDSDDNLIDHTQLEGFMTEAQARAEIVIWLTSNRYLKAKDLKL